MTRSSSNGRSAVEAWSGLLREPRNGGAVRSKVLGMPHRMRALPFAGFLVGLMVFGCKRRPAEPTVEVRADRATTAEAPRRVAPPAYEIAVVGDIGSQDAHEAAVAKLVSGWNPAVVVTTGDNIYPHGGGDYDRAVGAYYAEFIGHYRGAFGAGAPTNRFWPSPGNHDWAGNADLEGYRAYFTLPELPAAERYYDVALDPDGLTHLYVLDSDPHEPDGIDPDSKQASWLKSALAAAAPRACFNIVAFHHPPYTTLTGHAPTVALRWPFKSWGVDLVLTGHNHHYERLVVDGLPYVIAGHGGAHLYERRGPIDPASASFDDAHHGAVRVGVARGKLLGEAFTLDRPSPVDTFSIEKTCAPR